MIDHTKILFGKKKNMNKNIKKNIKIIILTILFFLITVAIWLAFKLKNISDLDILNVEED